jgi:hypothetical protein
MQAFFLKKNVNRPMPIQHAAMQGDAAACRGAVGITTGACGLRRGCFFPFFLSNKT